MLHQHCRNLRTRRPRQLLKLSQRKLELHVVAWGRMSGQCGRSVSMRQAIQRGRRTGLPRRRRESLAAAGDLHRNQNGSFALGQI
jgi:hypothetical protein